MSCSPHDRINLRDGGKAGVPHRLRMGSTERVLQLLQSTVGHHHCQMSGGVPGVEPQGIDLVPARRPIGLTSPADTLS